MKSMENRCEFVSLSDCDAEAVETFKAMLFDYIAETDEHINRAPNEEFREQCFNCLLALRGEENCHIEMCLVDGAAVGFFFGVIANEDDNFFLKNGCGYIREFYVRPEYRRRKYGKLMLRRLEELLTGDGADTIYLTAEPVTGKPFWEAMGYKNTGEKLPENQFDIYNKIVG